MNPKPATPSDTVQWFTYHDAGLVAVLLFGFVVAPFFPPLSSAPARAVPVHACARVGAVAPAPPAADHLDAVPPPVPVSPARAQRVPSRTEPRP